MKRIAPWLCLAVWSVCSALCGTARGADGDTEVLIVRRGWHIDVGINASDLNATLQRDTAVVPARYEFFGFADRRYLVSKHHSLATLAAVWRGRGVVLLTGIRGSAQDAFGAEQVITFRLSREQMGALQQFVAASIQHRDDKAEGIGPGPYSGSWYFESTQTYSGFHTCNTWVAEALRTAGVPVRSRGTLFAGQLWRQLKRLKLKEPSLAQTDTAYSQGGREPS
jgi:hypothetical protein